jgi:hypothetical protein
VTRPGTVITERDQAPPRTPPTDTGVAFVVFPTEKGPTAPTLVTSMTDFTKKFGARTVNTYGVFNSDVMETFFAEGGSKAYIVRRVGPAALQSSLTLMDTAATPAATLTVKAATVGEWGNNLKVAVEVPTAGQFTIVVSDATGELARGGPFTDKTAATAWATATGLITLTSLASALPPKVLAATALTGGASDSAGATDALLETLLNTIPRTLGPGQVAIPGATNITAYTALAKHASSRGRVAIADLVDSGDVATLKAAALAVRALGTVARSIGLFANWVNIGGLVAGTTRVVPPSASVLGRIAAVDAATNPNVPAAGERGRLVTALSLTQAYKDDDLDGLTDASVNTLASLYGDERVFGFRTAADKTANPLHWQLANVRLDMAIRVEADAIAQRYVFQTIDGAGVLFAQFGAELAAMLQDYTRQGALYGNDNLAAYRVDTSAAVNTPETIADGRIKAVLSVRRSPMAELAEIEIVKSAVNAVI